MFAATDFRYASFGLNLECSGATFSGEADFNSIRCVNSGFFRDVRFELERGSVSFGDALFGGNLEAQRAVFNGPLSLNRTRCEGSGHFTKAELKGCDFAYSYFGRNLTLEEADFAEPLDLTQARVEHSMLLNGVTFRSKVALYGAVVGLLVADEGFTFQKESLHLQRFVIHAFRGGKDTAVAFVRAQDPIEFSREPYLQLEKYYTSVGDEVEAKKMHYRGRRDLRENVKKIQREHGIRKWPPWTKAGDVLLKYLTGYGVRTWLLSIYIVLFLIVGTCIFWQDSTVRPRASVTSDARVAVGTNTGELSTPSSVEEQRSSERTWQTLSPFAYSLDLFLPLVNLRYDERWEPTDQVRVGYALVHAMAGWLLVPLLVASLAGIVRRQ